MMLSAFLYALALGPAAPAERVRPAAVELSWEAPDACPDEEAMRDRIAQLVVDPAGEGSLLVDGRVEEGPTGYRLTLRTSYGELSDERTVVDRDCAALGGTAALFVAVSLEPAPAASNSPRDPEPEPADAAPEESLPVLRRPPRRAEPAFTPAELEVESSEPTAARPTAVAVGLGPQLEFGALPGVTGGPRLSVSVEWLRAEVALYGYYGAPRRTDVVRGASGLVQMGAAGGRGCVVIGCSVRAPLCVLAEAGGLRVASRNLVPANDLRYVWSAVGARGGVARRWGRVGVFAAAEAALPTSRSRVVLGETTAFATWAVSLRAILGLQIFFATDSA